MKKQFYSLLVLLAASGHSLAADVAEPVAPAGALHDWSGAYVGVAGGWAHGRTKATDVDGEEYGSPGTSLSMTDNGFIGGVSAGYNFQRGAWVFGPELELGWAGVDKTHIDPNDDEDGVFTQYGFYGTATGRLGYAANRTLVYGKAGLAFAQIKSAGGEFDGRGEENSGGYWGFDGDEAGFGDKLRLGWTIGAGIEHALSQTWSVKAEYMFADFGSSSYENLDDDDSTFRFKDQLHSLKLGVNYRF